MLIQLWNNRGVAMLAVVIGLGGTSKAEEASQEKDYILYTGADLKVLEGGKKYPVVGISEFSVTIDRNGRIEKIPFDKVGRFWIDREMKLNNKTAAIDNLRSEKAFTPGREEVADWGTLSAGGYARDQGALEGVGEDYFEEGVALQNDGSISRGFGTGDVSSTGGSELLDQQVGEVSLDAFEVSLKLASEDLIANPYLVLVTDYRNPAVPDQFFRKFMVRMLDGISREPVSIRLLQGGFPGGFEVEEFNLYLYSRGREVPTNLSDKQIALTTDEAFQYLILEYLVGHKGETLPPRPMWVSISTEVKEMIRGLEANPEVHLVLDTKGRVVDLTVDGPGSLDSAITGAFRTFRFFPALESGKPVEGSYALKPKELVR